MGFIGNAELFICLERLGDTMQELDQENWPF